MIMNTIQQVWHRRKNPITNFYDAVNLRFKVIKILFQKITKNKQKQQQQQQKNRKKVQKSLKI